MNGYVFCRITNRCFRIDYHSTTWDEAREICQDDGGDLATFAEDIPDLVWIDKQLNIRGKYMHVKLHLINSNFLAQLLQGTLSLELSSYVMKIPNSKYTLCEYLIGGSTLS